MKVNIDIMPLSSNTWVNDKGEGWYIATLLEYVKENKLESFKMPLVGCDLSYLPFDVKSLKEFIFQMKRVNNTDLKYPILIDDNGSICDGYHRLCKAILNGDEYIDAIRIDKMPPCNFKDE